MTPQIPTRTSVIVCAALLLLVALTAGLSYVNLGPFNMPLALTIAAVKALLIVLFFMHIRVSSRLVRLASAVGVAWLVVLFTLTLSDYVSRGAVHVPGK